MGTVDMSITGNLRYNKFPIASARTRSQIAKAISITADNIVRKAQMRAKHRTGNMKRQTKVLAKGPMSAKVGAMAPYSGYLDFGTRYITADRWFSGAVDMERGQFSVRMSQAVNEAWAV